MDLQVVCMVIRDKRALSLVLVWQFITVSEFWGKPVVTFPI